MEWVNISKKVVVVVIIIAFMLLLSNPVVAQGEVSGTSPPSTGDWIISDTTYVFNETIILNGSLIVTSDANLTLDHVTLLFNCSYDGEFNITVQSGGSLNITYSTISSVDIYRYFISIKLGAHFYLSNSYLKNGGYSSDNNGMYSGLYVSAANAKIINNTIEDFYYGLSLDNAHNAIITGNTINNTKHGIYITDSNNVTIKQNTILNSEQNGIYPIRSNELLIGYNTIVESREGIWLDNAHNSTIIGNVVHNQTYGMNIWHVRNSRFLYNEFYYSTSYGWPIWDSFDNVFIGNKIHDTPRGVHFWSSANNLFYFNMFYNNTIHVSFSDYSSINSWDNGTFGNYWDDYNGTDSDGDGIGDTPYVLNDNNTDHKPLLYPYAEYTLPPEISDVQWWPERPFSNECVTVSAIITDKTGVDFVGLEYRTDGSWILVEMQLISDNNYTANIPAFSATTVVHFRIRANDSWGNLAITEEFSYTVADVEAPIIESVNFTPKAPLSNEPVVVSAKVTDDGEIDKVVLYYNVSDVMHIVEMTYTQNHYQGTIPEHPEGTYVSFKIFANDTTGKYSYSKVFNYVVQDITPPQIYNITWYPESPLPNESVAVNVTVVDSVAVDSVVLHYWYNGNEGDTLKMSLLTDNIYTVEIPAYSENTTVYFRIIANDTSGNTNMSGIFSYTVKDVIGPSITNVVWLPQEPLPSDILTINATVYDPSGVDYVMLWYNLTTPEGKTINMSHVTDNLYSASITGLVEGKYLYFKVIAIDSYGNTNETQLYSVLILDITPSTIVVSWSPEEPNPDDTVEVTAEVYDSSDISEVILSYGVNDSWTNVTMTIGDDGKYHATIPAYPEDTVVEFKVYATDVFGNTNVSDTYSYKVRGLSITPGDGTYTPSSTTGNEWFLVATGIAGVGTVGVIGYLVKKKQFFSKRKPIVL